MQLFKRIHTKYWYRKTSGEVNISHENTAMVVWIYGVI